MGAGVVTCTAFDRLGGATVLLTTAVPVNGVTPDGPACTWRIAAGGGGLG